MKEPLLSGAAFLADIRRASAINDHLHVWWLGQSGFLVQWHGRHILLDPYLSDSLTKKYKNTDKPHVRMTQRVISPDQLNFIDAVTSSHNHTDHLDAETINPLREVNPYLKIIVPQANCTFAAKRLQCDPGILIGMNDNESIQFGEFHFTALPAAHEAIEQDAAGNHKYLGYVVRCGDIKLYHSGDTIQYDGMVERLLPHKIDIALLPINGRNPKRRVPGNLTGAEAARLAKDIQARIVIPCHYDLFEFNSATPDELIQEAERIGQKYHILQYGERLTYPTNI